MQLCFIEQFSKLYNEWIAAVQSAKFSIKRTGILFVEGLQPQASTEE